MRGIILAAGIGSRLRPLTLSKPKCCVTVGGTSVLARQLRAYADAGVTDVTVVAGYLADDVRAHCEDVARERPELAVDVVESGVYANTDNMYSLYLVREAVAGEPFVLSNGDAVFDSDLLADLVDADAPSAVAADPRTYSEEAMKVTVDDDDGRVSHIAKDVPEDAAHAISNDVYRFSAAFSASLFEEITRTIERGGDYGGWTEAAIDRVVRNRHHDLEPVDVGDHRWVEIDDFADLQRADVRFAGLSDLAETEAVFFDLDGTVYLDDQLVDDAKAVVERLRAAGVDVYFLTNNSSRWKDDYTARLADLGIPVEPEQVLLSTDGVIDYLQGTDEEVYVVGTERMRSALADNGVELGAEDPAAVVVGFDTELTYEKARTATLAIRNGARFLLAHPDAVCPTAEGFVPDCGAIGAMIERATDQLPDRVFGKPNAEMITHVLESEGYDPADVLVVGDRLETDVRLAANVGCESVCVLSGDSTRSEIEQSDLQPSLIAPDVSALTQFLPAADGRDVGADVDSEYPNSDTVDPDTAEAVPAGERSDEQ